MSDDKRFIGIDSAPPGGDRSVVAIRDGGGQVIAMDFLDEAAPVPLASFMQLIDGHNLDAYTHALPTRMLCPRPAGVTTAEVRMMANEFSRRSMDLRPYLEALARRQSSIIVRYLRYELHRAKRPRSHRQRLVRNTNLRRS